MALYQFGVWFNVVFLMINMVLMLNFVIAIMSSTFGGFEKVQVGLYMSTLIDVFPFMEWDDKYGSIIIMNSMLQWFYLIALPMYFIVDLCSPQYLEKLNVMMSHLIFMPIVLFIWINVMIIDLVLIPVAYLVQLARFIKQFLYAPKDRV